MRLISLAVLACSLAACANGCGGVTISSDAGPVIEDPIVINSDTPEYLHDELAIVATIPPVDLSIKVGVWVQLRPFEVQQVYLIVGVVTPFAVLQSPYLSIAWYVQQKHVVSCVSAVGYKVCHDSGAMTPPEITPEGSGDGAGSGMVLE